MKPLARQLYRFLSACGGNWRNTIFVSCPEPDSAPGFLMAADRDGCPAIMELESFYQLTGEQIDPAECYDGSSAQFSTYATTLIRNHLLDCCKAVGARLRNLPAIPLDVGPPEEDRPPGFSEPSVEDGIDALIDRLDADALLSDCKRRYSGVARLGIEALELKIRG